MTEHALWVVKSGSDAQQARVAVISNNLTHGNTTGFKRGRVVFDDIKNQNTRQVGAKPKQTIQLSKKGFQVGIPYYRVLPSYVGSVY